LTYSVVTLFFNLGKDYQAFHLKLFMLLTTLILMTLLAYRLGVFKEFAEHRQLRMLDQDVMLEIDEVNWEDRQTRFRSTHPHLANRTYASLGRRR